jgi:hypothetical protein
MKVSGLTFLGNSPDLDAEFKRMVLGLKLEVHKDELPPPNPARDENILDQALQDIKVSENHQDKLPIQKQDEEFHQ